MNAQSAYEWWSTFLSAVFGLSSPCMCLLVGVVDWCVSRFVRLICCLIILTASRPGSLLIFYSHVIDLLVLSRLPSDRVRLGVSGLYICITDVLSSSHSVVFRWLLCLGSFPPPWWQDNIIPIPEDPHDCSVANFRLIPITAVLSKVKKR